MAPRFLATIAVVWLLAWRCVAGETATAIATISAGTVTAITVTFAGSGYTNEPAVTLSGGGGSGATAKAILSGDTVSLIMVLTSGSGYTTPPTVTIEAPPETLGLEVERVPKLTTLGPVGSVARVERSLSMEGPWTAWTNVTIGVGGNVLVDLTPGAVSRFYRAVGDPKPVGPEGFVWIEPGTFVMGSPADEPDRVSDELQHTVTLTQGFLLSDHEVTQAEYRAVMGNSPSRFKGDTLPVDSVSWNDAVLYCQKLTERERAAGRITAQQAYRLPTEAEWEYAARAGTTGIRYGELDAIAWWGGNSGGQTHPVKGKQANAWGLHDMLGNVWEWCGDWYGAYPTGSVTDPTGPGSGFGRVCRGGGRGNGAGSARSAKRFRGDPGDRFSYLGFRPALSSMPLGLEAELVPKLTARGPVGSVARVEWSVSMEGPWTVWTNVTLGVGGNVLVDLTPGAVSRFYRAVGNPKPVGPEGFVWIEPGTFEMGSPMGEPDRYDNETQHTVTLTQGFWLSDHEVTQAEFQAVMGNNPSWFKGVELPVEQVSWYEAMLYCQKLTERERAAGRITAQQAYRLPTEAEWEYAARAGTTGIRYGELDGIAWHNGNSGRQTQPVKQKQPNPWGLYDMVGNVLEWCGDWYGEYPIGAAIDPVGPRSGSGRVVRGGSWYSVAGLARSAKRNGRVPGNSDVVLGFRPALSSVR